MELGVKYFHTIKSILNVEEKCLQSLKDTYFHTIKSILNNVITNQLNQYTGVFPYY